jgi:hypothetical protein
MNAICSPSKKGIVSLDRSRADRLEQTHRRLAKSLEFGLWHPAHLLLLCALCAYAPTFGD